MLNNDIMWLSSLVLFWGTMLSWETIQVNASTINEVLIILGTPWWIDGLVNSGFACWWVYQIVDSLCGGFTYGLAHWDGKPHLHNEDRSRRRRYPRSAMTASLLLISKKRRHFKAVKFRYEGWASFPQTFPQQAKNDQQTINFGEYDPSQIVDFLNKFPETTSEGIITVPFTKRANISSVEYPFCFSSQANEGNVIIDLGASVCISPHRLDFITYNKSAMKIKDQS
jgi:hypothetical protein